MVLSAGREGFRWPPESLALPGRNVSRELLDLASRCLDRASKLWSDIQRVEFANSARVLEAFRAERVSQFHLNPSTGYAYADPGRETLEKVFARVFGAPAACVSPHWVSGTHTLATVLRALLMPGDELLSLTGDVYETLKPVIGVGAPGGGSPGRLVSGDAAGRRGLTLWDLGVRFRVADVLNLSSSAPEKQSPESLKNAVAELLKPETRVVLVQRSRGYSLRRSCSVEEIRTVADAVHRVQADTVVMVDNCYGEFTEDLEPSMVGADIVVGSLIKNPGGGLCPTGGYAVGRADLVASVKDALYAPGIGHSSGPNPLGYRPFFQGLFLAPHVVAESLKGAVFASLLFERMGYEVRPLPEERRSDIVQCVVLGTPEKLEAFAREVQSSSPVDSGAVPEPWDMPGYRGKVIMAAGTFVDGSSIELSCDAPFEPPYAVYLQGGMYKEHVIMAVIAAASAVGPAANRAPAK